MSVCILQAPDGTPPMSLAASAAVRSLRPADAAWLLFFGLVAVAWLALYLMSGASTAAEVSRLYGVDAWRALCAVAAGDAGWGTLMAMWSLMTIAMMLPSALPMLRTYADLVHAGAGVALGLAALVAGYLAVWQLFAASAAWLQTVLAAAGLLTPAGESLSHVLDASLLGIAGLYQWSALKHACVSRCRAPLMFFLRHWRDGAIGAFEMGVRQGVDCLLCCVALMALAFVGGVMNLAWMGAALLFMTLEKLPGVGERVTRPLGIVLLAMSGWSAGKALLI